MQEPPFDPDTITARIWALFETRKTVTDVARELVIFGKRRHRLEIKGRLETLHELGYLKKLYVGPATIYWRADKELFGDE